MALHELGERSREARALANRLFLGACPQRDEGHCSCLHKEGERPLTAAERALGWVMRPFSAYDPERMCRACRAYWFAERAAQELHEAHRWEMKAEAVARASRAAGG